MENYTKLEEYMNSGNDSRIEKKRKNPTCGIAVLLLGLVVLIAGIRCPLSDASQMALISIGAIAALTGGVVLVRLSVSATGGYRSKSTGTCMKHYRRYVNADDRQKLLDGIRYGDMSLLSQVRKETSTCTLVQAYAASDGSIAVVQVEEYIPHDFIPMTQPMCLEGETAQILRKWLLEV